MSNFNSYNYLNVMKELEVRRTNLTSQLNTPSPTNKKTMKEITKINSILTYMADYKMTYLDEQPEKEVKETKEPKEVKKSNKKETTSYGIMGMMNK